MLHCTVVRRGGGGVDSKQKRSPGSTYSASTSTNRKNKQFSCEIPCFYVARSSGIAAIRAQCPSFVSSVLPAREAREVVCFLFVVQVVRSVS